MLAFLLLGLCGPGIAAQPAEPKRIDDKWFGRALGSGRYFAYAGYAAGAALLLIVGLVGWNRTLRRRIVHRTVELAEGEQRFRQMAENIREVFWLTDPRKETILYVSPAFGEIWGRSCAALYAAPQLWLEAVHPEDRERVREAALTRQADGTYDEEFRVVRPDGSVGWVRDRAFPVRNEAGAVYRIAGVAEEITGRRQSEGSIRKLNAELEQRVAERTAQLEAANRELDAFSYSVSHDLRAPLRAMDGYSQAVIQDSGAILPAQSRRYLEMVRAEAQRMAGLIDDLLMFSRLGRQALQRRPVAMAAVVQAALEHLASERAGRNVDLRIGDLPTCQGDPVLLQQVWFNLLSNAFKYTRKRPEALIEVGCAHTDGRNVYFVRDNGAGFDPRYADKLFGVFQRLHRAEDYEGTGVGLAIVQQVIQRHGGRVWAEAAVNQGATFFFTLEGEPAP